MSKSDVNHESLKAIYQRIDDNISTLGSKLEKFKIDESDVVKEDTDVKFDKIKEKVAFLKGKFQKFSDQINSINHPLDDANFDIEMIEYLKKTIVTEEGVDRIKNEVMLRGVKVEEILNNLLKKIDEFNNANCLTRTEVFEVLRVIEHPYVQMVEDIEEFLKTVNSYFYVDQF